MATIENLFTGNGSTVDYSFTFPYLAETDIKVSLGGVITTNWSLHNATTIRFSAPSGGATTYQEAGGAPKSSVAIRLYRDTDDEALRATFYPGSAIRANDLNENALQNLYVTQEAHDKLGKAWSEGDETIDSTETWYTTDDTRIATTKAIENRITAKITELPVSNLQDGAARQLIQTAANGSDVEWTNNVDIPGTLDVTGAATFDGTVTASTFTGDISGNAVTFTTTANNTADETVYPVFVDGVSGAQGAETDSGFTYNPSTGALTATSFIGNVTGNTSGSSGSCTGNAATATALAAAATVTNSEQAAHSVDDSTFFTTSASDARYFNVSTGDTIKDGDAFPDNDTTIATTAAINDRIIDLVDDVGGFVAIASENHFPNANPDVNNGTGTIVSIKELSENIVTGSGVTSNNSIAQTVGGTAVNITGLTQNTTYAAGFGMLVETTTTLNEYTFHRLTPKATEVTTVAGIAGNITTVAGISADVTTVAGISANVTTVANNNTNVTNVGGSIANVNTVSTNIADVNNFADLYQIASSAPGTDGGGNALADGDLYFNTSSNELQVYNGSAWQGGVTATGNFATLGANTFTGNQNYGDGVILQLGDSSDLKIYHENSGNTNRIQAFNDRTIDICYNETSSGLKKPMILAHPASSVNLYHNTAQKLATSATGITVTGEVAAGSASFTDDGSTGPVINISGDDDNVWYGRIGNETYHDNLATGFRFYVQDDGDARFTHYGNAEYLDWSIGSNNGTTNHYDIYRTAAGALYLYNSGNVRLTTTTAGITVTGTVTDSTGELRTIVQNTQAGAYTLVAGDAGKHILASGNITVPDSVFSAGQAITIVNNTAGNLTITKGTNMYNAADGTNANRTLGTRGMATLLFTAADTAYISGAGLT